MSWAQGRAEGLGCHCHNAASAGLHLPHFPGFHVVCTLCRYDSSIGWNRNYYDDMNWMAMALLYADSAGPANASYVATAEALFNKVLPTNVNIRSLCSTVGYPSRRAQPIGCLIIFATRICLSELQGTSNSCVAL